MRDDIKINDRALALQDQIIEKLEKVFDTDVELDVYNLGLIYEINLDETGLCKIVMTFTDTACDCAESLPIEIVAGLTAEQAETLVIAYEPVWAIGTGKVATADDAQEMSAAIRAEIAKLYSADVAEKVRVLYGGSVKSSSAPSIMGKEDVDGVLVGGASLQADEFAAIARFDA